MRRPVTPRNSLNFAFRQFRSYLDALNGKLTTEDQKLFMEMSLSSLEELRLFAVTSAVEAAPLKDSAMERLMAIQSAQDLETALSTHLKRELDIVGIESPDICRKLVEGLRSDDSLEAVVRNAFEGEPIETNIPFNHFLAEGILREALGMDGHKPDLEVSPDHAAARAYMLRVKLGAGTPGFGQADPEASPGPREAAVDDFLREASMEGAGTSRDEVFFVAVAALADDVVNRIEGLMGGDMPEDIKNSLYAVLEGAAHKTGPQLEISFSDEDPSP